MDVENSLPLARLGARIDPAVSACVVSARLDRTAKVHGTAWRQRVTKPDVKLRSKDLDEMGVLLVLVGAKQDKAAFKALFEHFAPRLKSFMMSLRTQPQMAEEIVQETLVNVWRKAGQFAPDKASASTWVFTIARNLRIDHLRKANRPEPDMNDPAFLPDPEPQASDALSVKQEADQLKKALEVLPEEQKAVLQLAFFKDKSHPEVAAQLGVPLGTVKSRIRLALVRLRSELGDTS